jgi:patatin-like phospholipase/acyl hydrolase
LTIDSTKIREACRAMSAATTFFGPIAIGQFQEQFVDGALGANNPVNAVWSQAQGVCKSRYWDARMPEYLKLPMTDPS